MTGVILFRAQPFHNGHLSMIKKAVEDTMDYDGDLHIFVGSADKVGTTRNPIPIEFRLMLIQGALHEIFPAEALKRIHVHPLNDLTDETNNTYDWGRYLFMKMLGKTHDSDMTIYYCDDPKIMLSWFDAEDRWCLRFKFLDRYENISATLVRKTILEDDDTVLKKLVPNFVYIHKNEIKKYIEEAK